jgi:ubiquinone/menaquinone biosynthesis C-methylase UbiE
VVPTPLETSETDGPMPPRIAYDLAAPYYDGWNWQVFWERNEAPVVEGLVGSLATNAMLLDVGTGTGRYVSRLARRCKVRVGSDISKGMLQVAKKRVITGTYLTLGDVVALPFRDACFDLVTVCRVLSHVRVLEHALHEIGRVLKPGAQCVVTDLDAEHSYVATRLPVSNGRVVVETHKRSCADVVSTARNAAGFEVMSQRLVRTSELLWVPSTQEYGSIDRTQNMSVFYAILLRKHI